MKLKSIILPLNYAKEEEMDYKLLVESTAESFEIQKKLNQWKHNYNLKILTMCSVGQKSLAVLIQREKKGISVSFNKAVKQLEGEKNGR